MLAIDKNTLHFCMFEINDLLMKRVALTFILACCALALAAQEPVRVDFQGAKPTISDFAWAYLSAPVDEEEEGCMDESTGAVREAWNRYRKGLPQEAGVTLSIDQKNGFVLYESSFDNSLLRVEMCYWNESDQKHKRFAVSVMSFQDGRYSPGQFDCITFYRYDNAAKTMEYCAENGFDPEYCTDDGAYITYSLPRSGKDITVTYWYESGEKQKTLKWDGSRFGF